MKIQILFIQGIIRRGSESNKFSDNKLPKKQNSNKWGCEFLKAKCSTPINSRFFLGAVLPVTPDLGIIENMFLLSECDSLSLSLLAIIWSNL